MSDPIEHRLRDSLSRHAGAATPTADGWTAIRERAERADRLFARRRRTFRLAASGALAALVAVAVPLMLDRIRSDDDIAFEPPPPITAETATPTPSPTTTEPTVTPSATPTTTEPTVTPSATAAPVWTAVDDGGALTPGTSVFVNDAAALGSRVVAVGTFDPSGKAIQGAVWVAEDGTDWRVVEDAEAFGGQPDTTTQVRGVVATSRGFVAVGYIFGSDDADTPLAWTSPDGTAWQRTELPDVGTPAAVTEVAGGRLVAVGGYGPSIWTSQDGGATWESIVLEQIGDDGTLEAVVAVGQRVVALGHSSVAISEDGGATWEQVARADAGLPENPSETRQGAVQDLLALPDGSLLAVLLTDSGVAAQTSSDGRTWGPAVALPHSPQSGNDLVEAVVTLDDGTLVAAGLAFEGAGSPSVPVVWTSVDGGRSWALDDAAFLPGGEGQVTALTATGDTLVAVGNGGAEAGGRAWTRPLP